MLLPACTGTGLAVFVIERSAESATSTFTVALLLRVVRIAGRRGNRIGLGDGRSRRHVRVHLHHEGEVRRRGCRHRRRIGTSQGRENARPSRRASQGYSRRIRGKRFGEHRSVRRRRTTVGHALRVGDVVARRHRIRTAGIGHAQVGLRARRHRESYRSPSCWPGSCHAPVVATVAVSVMIVPAAVPALTVYLAVIVPVEPGGTLGLVQAIGEAFGQVHVPPPAVTTATDTNVVFAGSRFAERGRAAIAGTGVGDDLRISNRPAHRHRTRSSAVGHGQIADGSDRGRRRGAVVRRQGDRSSWQTPRNSR